MLKLVEYSGGYYVLTVQLNGLTIRRVLMSADKPLEEVEQSERIVDGLSIDIPMEDL